MPFRGADLRRVQKTFDDALEAPYDAEVKLAEGSMVIMVTVRDPENNELTVAACRLEFDSDPKINKTKPQPWEDETKRIVADFVDCCRKYQPA